jgi:hypothetical protein
MGVLAQAKNGDEQFWNTEISCSQWEKAQHALKKYLNFFSFFLCSQNVPFKFPIGSQYVL